MTLGTETGPSLPEGARLAFKGILFDVYQWEQELFDGTTRTFEKLSRNDASVVIPVLDDRRILITYDEQPGREQVITFPGGGSEDGESPEEAAARELLEETGYAAESLAHEKSFQPSSKIAWTIHTFIGRNCRKVREPAYEAGERITLRVVTLDELIALADDERFQNRELQLTLVKARYDREVRASLETLLFG